MRFCVLPSITSTSGEWKQMIEDADVWGLTEVAFFPTCLSPSERQEAYKLLERSSIKTVPFVHLRHDMTPREIRYLKKVFGTKKFNLHSPLDTTYLPKYDLTEFKDEIFIENASWPWMNSIENWAGICLDVAHYEAETLENAAVIQDWQTGLTKYQVGVWHVSAIYDPPTYERSSNTIRYDQHRFDFLARFNYVRKYFKYLADTVVLELENPIVEQLKAKKYLEEMIKEELTVG